MSINYTEKWLVISACQAQGLGNCFSLLSQNIKVDTCDIWTFQNNVEEWKSKISSYDQLIISPEIKDLNVIDFSQLNNVTIFPGVFFRGYHPDLCGVIMEGGGLVNTPLNVYNSVIAFSGYKSQLSVVQTAKLFRDEVYQRVGFYDIWSAERENLFALYDGYGLDIRKLFLKWVRSDRFMHSMNHPKINVLYDIAALVVDKIKGGHIQSDVRPHDNLLTGPVYPTYPEIADRLGIVGSYLFKVSGDYYHLGLEDFIKESFTAYEKYPFDALTANSMHYQNLMQFIAEEVV